MSRRDNNYYTAAGTQFQIASEDDDPFDRGDVSLMAVAVENHTHADGRGLPVQRVADGVVTALALQDGAATDSKVGSRSIDQQSVPTSSSGTLTQLFSWLANRIRAIMGTTNWSDSPPISLTSLATHAARHGPTGADPLVLSAFGVWTSLNDGSGSGLDADLIDGKNVTVAATAPVSPTAGDLWVDTSV